METYRYLYFIKLRLANKSSNEESLLLKYKKTFYEAEEYFNQTSRRAKIKKQMEITDITDEIISVTLSSETSLTTPTLALQAFSRYIVRDKNTEHLVKNKALFRGEFIEMEQENKMSDVDLLKELIDIVVSGRKEQKQVLEEIKDVLLNSKK